MGANDMVNLLFDRQDLRRPEGGGADEAEAVWHISNKYYTAQVRISIKDDLDDMEEEARAAQAVIYFDEGVDNDVTDDVIVARLEDWHRSACHSDDDERVKLVVFMTLEKVRTTSTSKYIRIRITAMN